MRETVEKETNKKAEFVFCRCHHWRCNHFREYDIPVAIVSKLNFVDLVGSQRASTDIVYNKKQLKEAANINKSLVNQSWVQVALRATQRDAAHSSAQGKTATPKLDDSE